MGGGLALAAVVALALHAADLELGARLEGRSTAVAPEGASAETFTTGSFTPSAALRVEDGAVRAGAAYAVRIWSNDLEASTPAARTTQTADVRLELRPESPFSLQLTASAVVGRTDPLEDPFHLMQPGGPYVIAPASSLPYAWYRAGALGEVRLDLRTTLGVGAAWSFSRGLTAAAQAVFPPQNVGSADLFLSHRAGERDTLRLALNATRTWTEVPEAPRSWVSGTATAGWRHALSPRSEVWGEAGAGLTTETAERDAGSSGQVFPVAGVGLAIAAVPGGVGLELAVRTNAYVDPYTGELVPMTEARGALAWQLLERLSLTASVAARRSNEGDSTLGFADLWLRWSLRPRLSLEAGVASRWQHELRPIAPSYAQAAAIVAVSYGTGPLFGMDAPPRDAAAGDARNPARPP